MRNVLVFGCVGLSFLAGCMSNSTGVMPFGPDTYTVNVGSELGGQGTAKKAALTEASEHCAALGKEMNPVREIKSTERDFFGDAIPTYDFIFKCL
ncbi:hypothetical protein N9Y59_04580 [Planktomarina temperata]|nr:hypothetical protein [Planktomarina temperata]